MCVPGAIREKDGKNARVGRKRKRRKEGRKKRGILRAGHCVYYIFPSSSPLFFILNLAAFVVVPKQSTQADQEEEKEE